VLSQRKVTEDHLRVLEPAITAYSRGKITSGVMASAMTDWLHGKDYALGSAESLPNRILRAMEAAGGPVSGKSIADKLEVTADTVLHSLLRLEKRRQVGCNRETRPLTWFVRREETRRDRG
jgi:hypothetical protein